MPAYIINLVEVEDFQRIRHVRIEPGADRDILLIAGNNAQGKSSLIGALTVALGGAREMPADPVRHGAEQAKIIMGITSERGDYTIRRIIKPDGKQQLEVRGPDGTLRAAQTWLNEIIGQRFLDPVTFLSAEPKEQRRILLTVAGVDTTELDAKRASAYSRRTDVGRDLNRARGEYERLPAVPSKPPEARAPSTVAADLAETEAQLRQLSTIRTSSISARRLAAVRTEAVTSLRNQIAQLEASLAIALRMEAEATEGLAVADRQVEQLATPEAEAALVSRRTELQAEVGRADTAARWQASSEQINRRRADAEASIATLGGEAEKLSGEITEIDQIKAQMLAAATMPVEGLTFTDDGVMLAGVPLAQASQAEQLRCALAVSMRQSPSLGDVWVRHGSLLDSRSLQLLGELAIANGCRVWVERVGELDEGAIIIRDGEIAQSSDQA